MHDASLEHHLVLSRLDTSVISYCKNDTLFLGAYPSPQIHRAK